MRTVTESQNDLGWEGTIKIIQFHPPAMDRDTFPRPGCSKHHPTWPVTPAGMGCQQGIKARRKQFKFQGKKLGFFWKERKKLYEPEKNNIFFWGKKCPFA